jgi:hypothetical protein
VSMLTGIRDTGRDDCRREKECQLMERAHGECDLT